MSTDMTRVSNELTEARTVLSRAETALEYLRRQSGSYNADPDTEEILRDLEAVVDRLKRWRRLNKNGTPKARSRY